MVRDRVRMYDKYVKQPVIENPDMLARPYWNNLQ